MNIMRWLEGAISRFSLKYQIGAIGLIAIIGLLAIEGLYTLSNRAVDEVQAMADQAAAVSKLMAEIDLEMLQARRAEKDFLLRREQKYADRLAAVMKGVDDRFERIAAATANAERQGLIREAREGAAIYAKQFAELASVERANGLTENDGLQGAVRKSVHDVETALKSVDEPRLQVLMLMMRRHEKDFLARVDAKYGEEMKKRAAEFEPLLVAANLPEEQKRGIAANMATYHKDYAVLQAGMLKVRDIVKKLSENYAQFEPKLDKVQELFRADRERTEAEIITIRSASATRITIVIGVMAALVAGLCLAIGTAIFQPLKRMTGVMGRLATKDWQAEVPSLERRDEIGAMARAVQVFKEGGIENERLQREAEAARARAAEQEAEKRRLEAEAERAGAERRREAEAAQRRAEEAERQAAEERRREQERMKTEAEAARKREMARLADAFEKSVKQVVDAVSAAAAEMQGNATAMSGTAEETSRQAATVAAASEQASANVQTVASAAEELASSIQEISRQVAQSSRVAGDATSKAQATGATVDGLARAAARIGEVVGMITGIASQTNLLALNATIEAARAGEAGKGFAVVASEVKALANQTTKATEEISRQIEDIQKATGDAVAAIQSIGGTVSEIGEITTTIAAAVEEQTSATGEISRNVQEAATGTSEVSRNVVGFREAAGQTGSAAQSIKTAADDLSRQAALLSTEVTRFIAEVRAA